MWCLIVRQPYASLIAYGCKKWEFRSYDSTKRGIIAIASSRGSALKTSNKELNLASKNFPRGAILATAKMVNTFHATNKEIKESFTGTTQIRIHGRKFTVAKKPLGEPVHDIKLTIEDTNWKSYVWEMHDITPLSTPVALTKKANSPWITIEMEEPILTRKHLISSYF